MKHYGLAEVIKNHLETEKTPAKFTLIHANVSEQFYETITNLPETLESKQIHLPHS